MLMLRLLAYPVGFILLGLAWISHGAALGLNAVTVRLHAGVTRITEFCDDEVA